jgi:hypothetical protein
MSDDGPRNGIRLCNFKLKARQVRMIDDELMNEIMFCCFKLPARRVKVSNDYLRNGRGVRDNGWRGRE